jgi:hypothetical protein
LRLLFPPRLIGYRHMVLTLEITVQLQQWPIQIIFITLTSITRCRWRQKKKVSISE